MVLEELEFLKMGHSKSPQRMPPVRNRLEALYSDVVQQLEQLQFPNLRKTAKQYFQSTEGKGWIRSNSKKSTETKSSTPRDDAKVQERLKQPDMPPNLPEHHRQCLPHHSVNSECRAFPKQWIGSRSQRSFLDRSRRQETAREVTVKPSRINKAKSPSSSIRKVKHQRNEPGNPPPRASQSSSEIGRFRKSIETKNTSGSSSTVRTTVGCEPLVITRRSSKGKSLSMVQPLTPIETECGSTFSHTGNLEHNYEGASPLSINKLETRPASMALRREFNCNSLMEEIKSRRARDAKNKHGKRECRNAQDLDTPVAIVILRSDSNQPSAVRSRITKESTAGTLRYENTIQKSRYAIPCSEVPRRYSPGKKGEIEEDADCNGATRMSDQIGSDQPNSGETLDILLAQKDHSLGTASRTRATIQEALQALKCAHRWNQWGARTLHELARASKAAPERNQLILGWYCKHELGDSIQQPDLLLLPHDNDVMIESTRRGRVLDSREEEREFIRDLLVASGITNGDWVDKHHLLKARQHVNVISSTQKTAYRMTEKVGSLERRIAVAERRNKRKRIQKRILYDFVEELLRRELEFRNCAQIGLNLAPSIPEHQWKGQVLVQKVWNHLQICPSASDDICTTVQNILQRDMKSQGGSSWVEMTEVMEELDKMIYQDLMKDLLEELTTAKPK